MQPVATTLPTEVTTSVPVVETSVAVTAQRMDSTKILIMYKGGLDADHLRELETKGISSKGSAMIRSMGSRLDPRQYREVEPISFRDPTRKRHMSLPLPIMRTGHDLTFSIPGSDLDNMVIPGK